MSITHAGLRQPYTLQLVLSIGGGLGGLFAERHDTMMYNGYNEVSNLYKDMDLSVFF